MGDYGPPESGLTSYPYRTASPYSEDLHPRSVKVENSHGLSQHPSHVPHNPHLDPQSRAMPGRVNSYHHAGMGEPQYPLTYPLGAVDAQNLPSSLDRASSISPNNPVRSLNNYPLSIQTSNLSDPSGTDHFTAAHQLSVTSAGPQGHTLGPGSIGESDTHSPTSTRTHLGTGLTDFGMVQEKMEGDDFGVVSQQADDESGKLRDDKSDLPPSWSELKTKAGKERKRLPLACIACRRKKIRCSGEKPACKHCLRSRIPCVYKVTTRKAAPRTDYMAMLDKRLRRMEDRVIKVIPKEESGRVSNRAIVKPAIPGTPAANSGGNKKRQAEEAFGPELDEWANTKGPERPSDSSAPKDVDERQLLTEGVEHLPSKEVQQHLAEVFFDYLYGQSYHLLHKPSYMRKLAAGNLPPVLILAVCAIAARFSTHPQVRAEPAFLRGETWASVAREISLKRYDTPNITILIVYLILGLHEFGTCQGGRSWMFGGMAQRMAYALQLHQDLDFDPYSKDKEKLSPLDREIRRRTMWACFMMDRFNSSGTERPMLVTEQSLQLQLPVKEQYFQMEIFGPTEDLHGNVPQMVADETGQFSNARENMGVAAYQVRLVALWGRLVSYLNLGGKEQDEHPLWSPDSKLEEFRDQVKDFRESLPECMEYTPENLQNHVSEKLGNQFIFLHLTYNQIVLFMNRFALPLAASGRIPKDTAEFITEASDAAISAANEISSLVNDAMEHCVFAPFSGYCAFFSSTVHLRGVFSANPRVLETARKNLALNVKFLTHIKKHWGMFHFLAEHLKQLYRQHADADAKRKKQAQAPSSEESSDEAGGSDKEVFQYGDWFNKYPHGVSRTDYEDPAAEPKKEPGTDAVLGQKSDLQSVEQFFATLSPETRAAHQRKGGKRALKAGQKQLPKTQPPTGSSVHIIQLHDQMQQAAHQLEAQHVLQQTQQQTPYLNMPPNPLSQQHMPQQMYDAMQQQAMPQQTQQQQHQHFQPSPFSPEALALIQQQQAQAQQQQQQAQSNQQQPPHPMASPFTPVDRTSLLASYAGPMDPSTPSTSTTGGLNAWDMDLSGGLAGLGGVGGGGGIGNLYGGDTGLGFAWYPPFNVDPPDIGGDDTGTGTGAFAALGGGPDPGPGGPAGSGMFNSGFVGIGGLGAAGPEVDMAGLEGGVPPDLQGLDGGGGGGGGEEQGQGHLGSGGE
ncbi:MAG: hypothetical protein M1822_006521 [Bathelium mastoideum]|nr:MAG: hypothetical protein M1822_006521 [Bathelium mastoideum]